MGFDFIPIDETAASVSEEKVSDKSLTELADAETAKRKEVEDLAAAEAAKNEVVKTAASTKQSFVDYIKKNITSIAAEPATLGGPCYVLKLEFAYPEGKPDEFSAIYVTYEDGHNMAKILMNVPNRADPSKMTRAAFFKPGDSTDWVLSEGTDTAKGLEKSLVNVANSDLSEIVVKAGMTLLDAKSMKIKIQYPSKMYWESKDGGYNFSDKPVTSSNVKMRLTKDPSTLPENMAKIDDINGKSATKGEMAEGVSVCVEGNAKYCLSGGTDYEATMIEMLGTVVE
jgi:hypothetical protein